MRIVTLLENTSCREDLRCEHGLSLYVEAEGKRILFDAGQTGLFAQNATLLGVDLASVDLAVLSHGHYDHGGGLARFLQVNSTAPIYVSTHVFEPHFNALGKDIGMDPGLEQCPSLIHADQPTVLAENIVLYPASCLPCPFPSEPWGLETLRGGIRVPEDFRHEQYMLVIQGGKRILFSGCSHKGILNIVDYFRPDILIGGFHLSTQEDPRELARIARQLAQYPTAYCTGHCTGQVQYAHMKRILGNRLCCLSTGTELTVSENGDIILT